MLVNEWVETVWNVVNVRPKIAGKFDGYSEAWSKSTFPVKSIKELMRLTDEFEEKN